MRQYPTKRRLSTILDRCNDEMKAKFNSVYLFMENDGQMATEDKDVAI